MKVILLAAGVGRRFGEETKHYPKCLIPFPDGSCLLTRYLESFRQAGLKNIVIVVGHQKKMIEKLCGFEGHGLRIRFIENKTYTRGSILSLYAARKELLRDDCLIMDADVYFPVSALKKLIHSKKKTAFLADVRSKSTGEEMMLQSKNGKLNSIAKKLDPTLKPVAEATGIFKISRKNAARLVKIMGRMIQNGKTTVEYEEAYSKLLKETPVSWEPTGNIFWTEMDFKKDWQKIADTLSSPFVISKPSVISSEARNLI